MKGGGGAGPSGGPPPPPPPPAGWACVHFTWDGRHVWAVGPKNRLRLFRLWEFRTLDHGDVWMLLTRGGEREGGGYSVNTNRQGDATS